MRTFVALAMLISGTAAAAARLPVGVQGRRGQDPAVTRQLFLTMHAILFPTKGPRSIGPSFCRAVFIAFATCAGVAMVQPASGAAGGGATSHKPRIIVTTDLGADPDDEQSLVRLLVSANEFDIEGLIVSTGCCKMRQSNTAILNKIIDAYGKVLPNLQVHADGYPSHAYLRSISVLGPAGYGMADVGEGKDSKGSELIIAATDRNDPRPVWVQFWGGGNNLAQAIWKVEHTRSAAETAKFLSKVRVFDILGQDDAGAWIAKNFPDILFIRAKAIFGWQPPRTAVTNATTSRATARWEPFIPDTKWATEGDTAAFLHLFPNGLNNPEQIDQGGWGGRFSFAKQAGIRSMPEVARINKDAEPQFDPYYMHGSTPEKANAIKHWSKGYDNDFAARMDWSITRKYEDANHHPTAVVNGDTSRKVLEVTAAPGSTVTLDARGSSDPDKDALSYAWSFCEEPSSYGGLVAIENSSTSTATVSIPSDAGGKSIHLVLELHDNGSPNLFAYRRVIIMVVVQKTEQKTSPLTPRRPSRL